MRKFRTVIFFAIFFLSISIITKYSYADMGPKPTANILVRLNGAAVAGDFKAKMLVCVTYNNMAKEGWGPYYGYIGYFKVIWDIPRLDSSMPDRIQDIDSLVIKDFQEGCIWVNADLAWGGNCNNSKCYFSYSIPDRFKLAVELPSDNKIYVSNAVDRKQFNSTYTMNITNDEEALLKESYVAGVLNDSLLKFFLSLLFTISIEGFIAYLFFGSFKLKPNTIWIVILVNIITVPIVWLVINNNPGMTLPVELFAIFLESIIYLSLYSKQVSVKRIFIFTSVANCISFIAGVFFNLLFINIFASIILRLLT